MAKTSKTKSSSSAPTKKIKRKVSRLVYMQKPKHPSPRIPKTIRNFIEDKGS